MVGKSIWDKFKNMKSLLVDHRNCHFTVPSGCTVELEQLACKDMLHLHLKNKEIIAKNKKLPKAEQKEALTKADVDKDWFSPEWCTWKINFDILLFVSLRQPKENIGDDGEADSDGDDYGFSNNEVSSTKKLKAVKKRLSSTMSKSPTRTKQKELENKRKDKFLATKNRTTIKRMKSMIAANTKQ